MRSQSDREKMPNDVSRATPFRSRQGFTQHYAVIGYPFRRASWLKRDRLAALVPARAYYMINLLDVLRALGGTAHRRAVFEYMIEQGIARQADLETIQTDGGTRFRKHVDFARKELFDGGLVEDGGPGIWYLTPSGVDTFLSHSSANQLVALNQRLRPLRKAHQAPRHGAKKRRFAAGPTTGPKPVAWSGRVTRDNLQPAVTYIMQWGETEVWKVGHAIDIEKRISQVNKHIPVEVLQVSWSVLATHQWENCVFANAMEQEVFRILDPNRSMGERLRCTEEALGQAWAQAAMLLRRNIDNR